MNCLPNPTLMNLILLEYFLNYQMVKYRYSSAYNLYKQFSPLSTNSQCKKKLIDWFGDSLFSAQRQVGKILVNHF